MRVNRIKLIVFLLGISIIQFVDIKAQSVNDQLADRIGVGSHSTIVKSISQLLGVCLNSNASHDVFRYKNVTNVEYYNGSSWTTDTTDDWKNVMDGNDGNRWNIAHETIRFTIDLGGGWIRPSAILIGQDYNGGERQFDLKVESSNDQSTWMLRLDNTSTGSNVALNIFMLDSPTDVDRYIRLTITSTTDLGDPLSLFKVSGFTQRTGGLKDDSSFPFYTDFDRNIAIGTTTIPDGYKLVVDGKAIMEEVKVEISGSWPDYVFEEGYYLTDLEEIEEYVRANYHLPGLPATKEVEKEGVELGALNAKLLEKIEELTLYVIEINKILKAQGRELNAEREKLREQESRNKEQGERIKEQEAKLKAVLKKLGEVE